MRELEIEEVDLVTGGSQPGEDGPSGSPDAFMRHYPRWSRMKKIDHPPASGYSITVEEGVEAGVQIGVPSGVTGTFGGGKSRSHTYTWTFKESCRSSGCH